MRLDRSHRPDATDDGGAAEPPTTDPSGSVPREAPAPRATDFSPRLADRGGFALAIAVFAIVILAAVVAGGYFSASQEFQIGRATRSLTTSFYAGEAGIHRVLAEWDPVAYGALSPGDTASLGPVNLEGGGIFTASVIRVGSAPDSLKRYFYVEVVGRPAGPNRGERRQGMVVTAAYPQTCCDGALVFLGPLTFSGGGQVNVLGIEQDPPGTWTSAACSGIPSQNGPAAVLGPAATVSNPARLDGSPDTVRDDTLTPGNLFDFVAYDWNGIVQMANHSFAGDISFGGSRETLDANGNCDRSDPRNFGSPDPAHPCYDYFPIIHVAGTLDLGGNGYGQGIFIVGGDLNISGPFEFYGLVLAAGDLNFAGPVDFYGTARTASGILIQGNNPRVRLSRCAATRATLWSRLSRPVPMGSRAWIELF